MKLYFAMSATPSLALLLLRFFVCPSPFAITRTFYLRKQMPRDYLAILIAYRSTMHRLYFNGVLCTISLVKCILITSSPWIQESHPLHFSNSQLILFFPLVIFAKNTHNDLAPHTLLSTPPTSRIRFFCRVYTIKVYRSSS